MQSTSWETVGWKKHQLESGLPGEISKPQVCRWHHPYGRKWRGTKKPLDERERGEWKSWLKAQHSAGPITSWEIDGETVETVSDFIFGGLQNHGVFFHSLSFKVYFIRYEYCHSCFLWSLFAWNIFFQPFTFSLYVSLVLRHVSCRQHI